MKRYFVLSHAVARQNAAKAVSEAPQGMVVEIKEPTRNLEQNAKLWAMLSEVARQVDWYGRKLSAEDWKHVFTASLSKQDVVPGIDGGFVVLGKSTSKMSKREFADLIELISAFGAQRGVKFTEVAF
jgi:hypothetical protein